MRAARIDANQPEIVKALRDVGAFVQSLATIGKGCPDLLVAFRGKWHVLEVKDGAKPPSARKLTKGEMSFVEFLTGLQCACCKPTAEYRIVESIEQAAKL